ncbi:MAG: alpha/beta fold hydrolase [Pseudomonadota bacterium]
MRPKKPVALEHTTDTLIEQATPAKRAKVTSPKPSTSTPSVPAARKTAASAPAKLGPAASPAPAVATCPEPPPLRPDVAYDEQVRALLASMTGGVSFGSLALAWTDWAMHLAASPGKRWRAALQWQATAAAEYSLAPPFMPRPPVVTDQRFSAPGWENWPYCVLRDGFLRLESLWMALTSDVDGLSPHHQRIAAFCARQWLDMMSPSNVWWMNPTVLDATMQTRGANFVRGAGNFVEDLYDAVGERLHLPIGRLPHAYVVGRDVGITPGKVVYRNDLFELIQYSPTTDSVYREPVMIVPSWIMKYYILDLQPQNSMVKYLVDQGHTVFMLSWRNPGAEARDTSLDDYLKQGLLTALATVRERSGQEQVHAVGYCLGGTLLAIAAAKLARDKDDSLRSVTLFATETDFDEPGELGLFIDDSALSTLDALMRKQGYLDGFQMAQAFSMLRARDLVWSRVLREYLLGERDRPNDLMSWNRDTTRLPYRMHSEVLSRLFLRNELAEGRFCVDGYPVAMADVEAPMFVVGTEHDHVAPWKSAYKLHLLTHNALTFVLTSGGHNAGVVSEPGHKGRRYRVATRVPNGEYKDPDRYAEEATRHDGSWWPYWHEWLAEQSSGRCAPRDSAPGSLRDAPGEYVMQG